MMVMLVGNMGGLQRSLERDLSVNYKVTSVGVYDYDVNWALRAMDSQCLVIVFCGGEVRNAERFYFENVENPRRWSNIAVSLNARFIYLSSLAALNVDHTNQLKALAKTKYASYARSKHAFDDEISNDPKVKSCALFVASIDHPKRTASSRQKIDNMPRVLRPFLRSLYREISYCSRLDIAAKIRQAIEEPELKAVIVGTFEKEIGLIGYIPSWLFDIILWCFPLGLRTSLFFMWCPSVAALAHSQRRYG